MRSRPVKAAAAVLSAVDIAAAVIALLSGQSARWLAWVAVIAGVLALAGSLFTLTSPYSPAGKVAHRHPFYPLSTLLALLAAATGILALFSGDMVLVGWIAVGVSAITIALGVICSRVGRYYALRLLLAAAWLLVFVGPIVSTIILVANGHRAWAWLSIGVGAALVIGVKVAVTKEFRWNRLSPGRGSPGSPVSPAIGLVGPVLAAGTSVIVAPSAAATWVTNPGIGTTAAVAVGITAAQLAVQVGVVRLLQTNVHTGPLSELARISREQAMWLQTDWDRHRTDPVRPSWERDREWERRHAQELDLQRQRLARSNRAVGRGLLANKAAGSHALIAADNYGVVVDQVWPRIELVVPTAVRRRLAWLDNGIALSRVVAGSAAGAAGALALAIPIGFVSIPILVLILAVVAGRQQVAIAYARRADAVALYRIDLARTLNLVLPRTEQGLVAMGSALTGERSARPVELASQQTNGAGITAEEFQALRAELTRTVSAELASGLDRLTAQQSEFLRSAPVPDFDPAEIERFANRVAERTAEPIYAHVRRELSDLHTRLGQSVVEAVEGAMSGPELVNFTGHLVVELAENDGAVVRRTGGGTIVAAPGVPIELIVSLVSDRLAKDAVPDRRLAEEIDFLAQETIHIDGGRTDSFVNFEAVIDSATVTPSPHRMAMRVSWPDGEQRIRVDLLTPDSEGLHEAWIQLYQAGQLIQAMVITADTRQAST